MAEFGDALSTAITSQTEARPSIFEIIAQDNLNLAVRPAIKHVIKVFAENYPQRLSCLYSWFDELYTVIESGIQYHFLSNYSASYAEHYYDLKRSSTHSSSMQLLSIAALTLFPYLKIKLDKQYNSIKEKYIDSGCSNLSKNEIALFYCYPIVNTIWNFSYVCYSFFYAVGKSMFHSPLYKVLNIKLEYLDPILTADNSKSELSRLFTRMLTGGVHAGVFVIQFIEWWFNDDIDVPLRQIIKKKIPPPPTQTDDETIIPLPDKNICPLCNKTRTNDTALMTSGYVFCYVCLYKYVKEKQRCPVTGFKTDLGHLVKIYSPTL